MASLHCFVVVDVGFQSRVLLGVKLDRCVTRLEPNPRLPFSPCPTDMEITTSQRGITLAYIVYQQIDIVPRGRQTSIRRLTISDV